MKQLKTCDPKQQKLTHRRYRLCLTSKQAQLERDLEQYLLTELSKQMWFVVDPGFPVVGHQRIALNGFQPYRYSYFPDKSHCSL